VAVIRLYHLAAAPPHAKRKADLFQRLLALQKEFADQFDLAAAFPGE